MNWLMWSCVRLDENVFYFSMCLYLFRRVVMPVKVPRSAVLGSIIKKLDRLTLSVPFCSRRLSVNFQLQKGFDTLLLSWDLHFPNAQDFFLFLCGDSQT